MIVSLLAAVVLMTQAAPAASAPTAPAPAAATPQQKKLAKEGMVCRNEPVMGSKLPKRVCSTPQQDANRRKDDRELTEYIQRSMRLPCDACN